MRVEFALRGWIMSRKSYKNELDRGVRAHKRQVTAARARRRSAEREAQRSLSAEVLTLGGKFTY